MRQTHLPLSPKKSSNNIASPEVDICIGRESPFISIQLRSFAHPIRSVLITSEKFATLGTEPNPGAKNGSMSCFMEFVLSPTPGLTKQRFAGRVWPVKHGRNGSKQHPHTQTCQSPQNKLSHSPYLSVNLHPLELGSKELHTQKREIDFTRPLPPLFQSKLERLERVALLDQVGLSREGRDCTRKQRTCSTKNMEVWNVLESAEPPSMLEVYDMRSVTLGRARPLLAESEF